MSSKSLQTPQIIEILASTITIKHPDLSVNARTSLLAQSVAGNTSILVRDNSNFEDDDYFIFGEIADAKTEEGQVNGAVTRGQSLTIENTSKFNHSIDTPITKIYERKIKIYGAATNGGVGVLIASVGVNGIDIEWDKQFTSYTLLTTDTAYNFYYATFFDGTTESSASEYVASSGLTNQSVARIVESGLNAVNADIDNNMVTERWLLSITNDAQDQVLYYTDGTGIAKDWAFEVYEDRTSLVIQQNENEYSLDDLAEEVKYPNSQRGIFDIFFGDVVLIFRDLRFFDRMFQYKKRTNLAVQALAGDTSITVDDAAEFAESGTLYIGSDIITYTTVNKTTNVISGIPASGANSITTTHPVDTPVWQGVNPGLPRYYTIWNDKIILDKPPEERYDQWKLKIKYLRKLPRIDSFSDTISMPYTYILKDYIGAMIEYKKNNQAEGDRRLQMFQANLQQLALRDPLQIPEPTRYHNYDLGGEPTRWPRIENDGFYNYW